MPDLHVGLWPTQATLFVGSTTQPSSLTSSTHLDALDIRVEDLNLKPQSQAHHPSVGPNRYMASTDIVHDFLCMCIFLREQVSSFTSTSQGCLWPQNLSPAGFWGPSRLAGIHVLLS